MSPGYYKNLGTRLYLMLLHATGVPDCDFLVLGVLISVGIKNSNPDNVIPGRGNFSVSEGRIG